ncbi:MAG: hypothetical protein AAF655_06930, partial [Bacteroidota bacterium]
MKKYLLLSITFFLLLQGCHWFPDFPWDDPKTDQDFLIFGDAYGFCLGNCTNLYKIEDGLLFADDIEEASNIYLPQIDFLPNPMPEEAFEIAKPLTYSFPEELWAEKDSVIGIPDAYDQGTIVLEAQNEAETRRWYIDTNEGALPDYLVGYIKEVKKVLTALRCFPVSGEMGRITGPDFRECSCCGGYFLEIGEEVFRFYDEPYCSDLALDVTDYGFPLEVWV